MGPYIPNTTPPYFGTNWLIDTIQAGATEAKHGSDPIAMPIVVVAISAPNGPGTNEYHDGHDAGMAVDFALPNQVSRQR